MAELAIRTAMLKLGSGLLERVLDLDRGHRGPEVSCGGGHWAGFRGYRDKTVDTVLGVVRLRRAYYHCRECGRGLFPRDRELGIQGSSLSPGLRRMVARLGSQEPFAKAGRDLLELAGLRLTGKRVERSSEADGEKVRAAIESQAQAVIEGKVVPLGSARPIPLLYVAMDGTGVPTIPADTKGRRGKGEDGRAHTREAKLGCLFTQTGLDDRGHPRRDPASSSYVATLDSAAAFGALLYAEALRRGLHHAERVVVLGDGAPWIWNLADEHFPRSLQVVDLYHAREHVHALGAQAFPTPGEDSRRWLAARLADLERGDIDHLVQSARDLQLPPTQRGEVQKHLPYFEVNRERMRYAHFRELGVFVGSGTVEAGCKSVVAHRLKQSGMRWSVRGSAAILSLRCQEAAGPSRWDQVWQWFHFQTTVA